MHRTTQKQLGCRECRATIVDAGILARRAGAHCVAAFRCRMVARGPRSQGSGGNTSAAAPHSARPRRGPEVTTVVDVSVLVAALVDSGREGRWAESTLAEGHLVGPESVMVDASNILRC